MFEELNTKMQVLKLIQHNEKIAVTIPTKNRPSYLAVLLSSLLNQTYKNFMIVINDQSELPVQREDAVSDLLALTKNTGHELVIIRTEDGWKRHQQAMEAVPESIEFIMRIDDDMLPDPCFIESMLKPFGFFTDSKLAAVGGCFPGIHGKKADLDVNLRDRSYKTELDDKTWMLQGYHYHNDPEVIEVDSLLGGAICYRRSAVEDVGGWAVPGYSDQAYREESDLCARLWEKGYSQVVTTEAIAWHLEAPGGGGRKILKTPSGNILVSDDRHTKSDHKLFNERMRQISASSGQSSTNPKRYKVKELEKGIVHGTPHRTILGAVISIKSRIEHRIRRIYWRFRK